MSTRNHFFNRLAVFASENFVVKLQSFKNIQESLFLKIVNFNSRNFFVKLRKTTRNHFFYRLKVFFENFVVKLRKAFTPKFSTNLANFSVRSQTISSNKVITDHSNVLTPYDDRLHLRNPPMPSRGPMKATKESEQ